MNKERYIDGQSRRNCILCSELAQDGCRPSVSAGIYPYRGCALPILVHSPSFVAVPDLAPVTFGHTLVVSRRHLVSMRSSPSLHRELLSVLSATRSLLTRLIGSEVIVFEHGGAKSSHSQPCTISHAHAHLVPSDVPMDLIVQRCRDELGDRPKTGSPLSFVDLCNPWTPYLMIGTSSSISLFQDGDSIPSQFMRLLLHSLDASSIAGDWKGAATDPADGLAAHRRHVYRLIDLVLDHVQLGEYRSEYDYQVHLGLHRCD